MPAAPAVTLLGREDETAALAASIAADRSVAVVGEAGIGKTSLIRVAVAASGRRIWEGGGFGTLTWMPYLALSRAAGRPMAGDPADMADALEATIGPDVLFIDDLHWVDGSSRAVLERIAGRVQILTAIRDGDEDAVASRDLVRRLGFETLEVGGLGDAASAALIRAVRPDAPPGLVERLVRSASGNPRALEEMARAGGTAGVLARSLEARRARLSDAGRLDLDLLAVADRPLATTDLPAADELVRAGLATRRGEEVAIRHALLADAILTGLDAESRRAAHGRAAVAVGDSAGRARHLLAAGRAAEAAAVARSGLVGTGDPAARGALLATVALASGEPDDRLAAAIALDEQLDPAGILDVLGDPAADGPETPDLARVLRIRATAQTGAGDAAWALAESMVARGVPPAGAASVRLAIERGVLLINHRADPAAAAAVIEAELARGGHDERDRLRLAGFREAIRPYLGEASDVDVLIAVADTTIASRPGDAPGTVRNAFIAVLLSRGAEPALRFLLDAMARFDALGRHASARELAHEAAQAAIFAGHFREAVALAERVTEAASSIRARAQGAARRAEAFALLGALDLTRLSLAGAPTASQAADEGERLMAEIEIEFWSGAPARVVELLAEVEARVGDSPANLVLPRLTAAWADLELGRTIRDVPPAALRAIEGASPELAGIRALAASEPAAAIDHFDSAAERWSGFIAAREAVCRWAAGEAARRAERVEDAVTRLRDAADRAATMEFEPLLRRINRSLRLAGVRVPGAERGRAPGLELTRREAEVVALVEAGLTNLDIARRLGLGRPTVARMVASSMAKLGVERRAQLAARVLA